MPSTPRSFRSCAAIGQIRTLLSAVLLAAYALGTARADEAALLSRMTPAEQAGLVHGIMALPFNLPRLPPEALGSAGYIPGIPRLGVPALQETDASLGIANPGNIRPGDGATPLPSGLALASTWNPDMAFESGAMIGDEAWRKGFNVLLAGGVNLARDPRAGRNFEYLGEDPLLAGRLAGAEVRGIQSRHVISTVKHFVLNDQETQRNTLDARIGEAALRESDLLAFEIAIETGQPGAVMCAYNKINGVHACENDRLLNRILKGDWHYPGWVMSDWGAVHSLEAALHGLDQESGEQLDPQVFFSKPLPPARLADMVRRILRSMTAVGLFDHPPQKTPIDTEAHARRARGEAEEGIVLLKNVSFNKAGSLLPLTGTVKSIAVIGGHADRGVLSGGGSAQVIPVGGPALVVPTGGEGGMAGWRSILFDPSSPLAAIRARAPAAQVAYDDGRYPGEAALLAKRSDVAIVFATQWMMEGYDAPDLSLPEGQDALIAAVAAANPRTIVVLETGGPVVMPWLPQVPALLEAWYPGARGGEAIADILFGAADPSGRLPMTFPARDAQLRRPKIPGFDLPEGAAAAIAYDEGATVGYRDYDQRRIAPLFPFGFGLSYTTFAYKDLTVAGKDGPNIAFTVTNTGTRPGADVPQIYLTTRPGGRTLRLLGWSKLALRPGESRRVTVQAEPRVLADFDPAAGGWHIPGGDYEIAVGSSSAALQLRGHAGLTERRLAP